tara:strand:- start:560 stop:985 length:426 start_codon:yes stop_codon:yes gene_type:complete
MIAPQAELHTITTFLSSDVNPSQSYISSSTNNYIVTTTENSVTTKSIPTREATRHFFSFFRNSSTMQAIEVQHLFDPDQSRYFCKIFLQGLLLGEIDIVGGSTGQASGALDFDSRWLYSFTKRFLSSNKVELFLHLHEGIE